MHQQCLQAHTCQRDSNEVSNFFSFSCTRKQKSKCTSLSRCECIIKRFLSVNEKCSKIQKTNVQVILFILSLYIHKSILSPYHINLALKKWTLYPFLFFHKIYLYKLELFISKTQFCNVFRPRLM